MPLIKHELTIDADIDAPETTRLRRRIIQQKPFLRKLYEEWYALIKSHLPAVPGDILEIGTGPGFMKSIIPYVITSDVLPIEGIDVVLPDDGHLPFADGSLRAVVMTNVFHHVSDVRRFLGEASRTVRPGGRLIMIEPWNTPWARFVYQRLHPEPFDPQSLSWALQSDAPLSGANGALPWIVFQRDRKRFENEFPAWSIMTIILFMPFAYLLSGGISLRSLCPGCLYRPVRFLEHQLERLNQKLAMFALIVVERVYWKDTDETMCEKRNTR